MIRILIVLYVYDTNSYYMFMIRILIIPLYSFFIASLFLIIAYYCLLLLIIASLCLLMVAVLAALL
jgi:hypothetical protein